MKAIIRHILDAVKIQYKKDFDKELDHRQTIQVGKETFFDRPTHVTFISDHENELGSWTYSKLMEKSIEPYKELELC